MGSMHTGLEETGDWDRVAAFYAERARHGTALMVTGGMAPNAEGAVLPGAAGLFTPEDVAHHRRVTDAVHAEGGRIAMQVLHAGRYAYNDIAVAPSALKAPIAPAVPRALDEDGIEKQIADIVTAAVRAGEAGYDGVEIMGSEGYFLNQFLAPRTNRRTDRWGGAWENRARLPLEVVRRTREATGAGFILIYRISLLDLVEGGQTWEEVVRLARAVEAAGADLLNSGIGWHEARIPTIATSVPRAAFAWVTRKLMGEVGIPLVTSNRINTPEVAEELLATGHADMVSMARPFLADAAFVAKARAGRARLIAPCIACNQACLDHTFELKVATCLVNPRAAHETELPLDPAPVPRRIAVVGAGPAGLAAALTAAGRGHAVTLFEAAGEIGGQLNMAKRIPGKEEFIGLVDYYRTALAESTVALRLGHAATPADLAPFDEIVLATGVTPRPAGLPGEDAPHVLTYVEAILHGAPVGAARRHRRRRRHRLRRGRVPRPCGPLSHPRARALDGRMGRHRPRPRPRRPRARRAAAAAERAGHHRAPAQGEPPRRGPRQDDGLDQAPRAPGQGGDLPRRRRLRRDHARGDRARHRRRHRARPRRHGGDLRRPGAEPRPRRAAARDGPRAPPDRRRRRRRRARRQARHRPGHPPRRRALI
jgi:2,4-dienoyl-CoA reductase (NADPH2)